MHVNAEEPISSSARDLVEQLLSWDPAERPSAEEVLNHPFLRPPSRPLRAARVRLLASACSRPPARVRVRFRRPSRGVGKRQEGGLVNDIKATLKPRKDGTVEHT